MKTFMLGNIDELMMRSLIRKETMISQFSLITIIDLFKVKFVLSDCKYNLIRHYFFI